ncbi:MAG: hypothetical protein AB1Z29_23775, partial [Desulfobacterales bacterium]
VKIEGFCRQNWRRIHGLGLNQKFNDWFENCHFLSVLKKVKDWNRMKHNLLKNAQPLLEDYALAIFR